MAPTGFPSRFLSGPLPASIPFFSPPSNTKWDNQPRREGWSRGAWQPGHAMPTGPRAGGRAASAWPGLCCRARHFQTAAWLTPPQVSLGNFRTVACAPCFCPSRELVTGALLRRGGEAGLLWPSRPASQWPERPSCRPSGRREHPPCSEDRLAAFTAENCFVPSCLVGRNLPLPCWKGMSFFLVF